MSAVRLVPAEEAAFPYSDARRRLEQDGELTPKDFRLMIEAGRRMGWSEELIQENERLAARGNCFDFTLSAEPFLSGSLFEDNIFFSVTGDPRSAREYIQRLADELGVRVHQH